MILVNPTDSHWTRHRFILAFGAYGDTVLMAWANSLEDALDECVDWIAANAPELLADDQVREEYERLLTEEPDLTDDCRWERACEDTMCAGNSGHYLLSWEWGIVAEDPDRATVLRLQGRL